MQCPYCGKEMIRGHISIYIEDGGRVSFYKEHTVMSVFDELNGAGIVTAAKKVGRLYKIDADYCDVCKKMIFDTDVTGTSPEEGPKYYQYQDWYTTFLDWYKRWGLTPAKTPKNIQPKRRKILTTPLKSSTVFFT